MVAGLAALGALAALAALAVRRPWRFVVVGHSMLPTLAAGDRVLVTRARRLAPGDVVVVADPRDPSRLVVKRVASISGGDVTVRGDNPATSTDSREFGPVARSAVRGRVAYRYGPPHRRGLIPLLVP